MKQMTGHWERTITDRDEYERCRVKGIEAGTTWLFISTEPAFSHDDMRVIDEIMAWRV